MSRRKSKKHTAAQLTLPTNVSAKNTTKKSTRNSVAANPLLGKSAVHGKTYEADRRANKVSLRKLPLERIACQRCVFQHPSAQALGSSGSLELTAFSAAA